MITGRAVNRNDAVGILQELLKLKIIHGGKLLLLLYYLFVRFVRVVWCARISLI